VGVKAVLVLDGIGMEKRMVLITTYRKIYKVMKSGRIYKVWNKQEKIRKEQKANEHRQSVRTA
jgi:hypothetical protein